MTGIDDAPGGIRLHDVSHAWPALDGGSDVVTLDRIDLDVDPGAIVAIVGPSGCGKSTLLRILAGLTVPSRGTATIAGRDVVGRPGSAAWMPQHHALLPWRRVLANATLGAEVGGTAREEAEARARPLLERFGLGGYERAWPVQLSGGMRQRLAVLRTFLVDAPVLLLDEPFGALDALTRRSMQSWIQEVLDIGPPDRPTGASRSGASGVGHRVDGKTPGGRTVVVVTHDVEEALLLADRVVVLSPRPGRLVADVEVPFARPRPPSLVADPDFVALRASLLESLGA